MGLVGTVASHCWGLLKNRVDCASELGLQKIGEVGVRQNDYGLLPLYHLLLHQIIRLAVPLPLVGAWG